MYILRGSPLPTALFFLLGEFSVDDVEISADFAADLPLFFWSGW